MARRDPWPRADLALTFPGQHRMPAPTFDPESARDELSSLHGLRHAGDQTHGARAMAGARRAGRRLLAGRGAGRRQRLLPVAGPADRLFPERRVGPYPRLEPRRSGGGRASDGAGALCPGRRTNVDAVFRQPCVRASGPARAPRPAAALSGAVARPVAGAHRPAPPCRDAGRPRARHPGAPADRRDRLAHAPRRLCRKPGRQRLRLSAAGERARAGLRAGNSSSMATTSRFSTCASRLAATPIRWMRRSRITRASGSRRAPASVSTGLRPERSKSSTPRSISRFATWVLMADCALPKARPAAENEPCSAAAAKASSCSMETCIHLLSRYELTFISHDCR